MPAAAAARARQDFAVAVLHAGEADRREDDGRGDLLPDHRGGEAALGDIHQHALAQLDRLQIGAVGAQRFLLIGAAIGVIEKGARHLAAGKRAQVVDVGDVFHGPPRTFGNVPIG